MNDNKHLSKAELAARLRRLRTVSEQERNAEALQHLQRKLEIRETELEMQSRELLETQRALEESRDRYAELYDFTPVGFLTLDARGCIERINLTGAALFGYERARLEGQLFSAHLAAGQRQAFFRHLRETLASNAKHSVELRFKSRDRSMIDVRLESVAAGPESCRTVLIDVSELRQAKRDIDDRQVRLQAILDTAADGIITIDLHGIVQSFNQAAERIFGYSADEVISRNVSMLMPAPHREHHDGYIQRYLDTHEARIIGIGREMEGQRKDGSVFPLDLAVAEVRDDGLFFTGIIRDITERRATETRLRESEEQFRQFSDHAQQIFWIINLTPLTLRYINAAYDKICGCPRPHPGTPLEQCLEIVHADDRSAVLGALARASDGQSFAIEFRILRPDGELRWLRQLGFPIRDETSRIYRVGGIAEDITDTRKTQEEMQILQSELSHLGRLSLASEMAAGLAHELNQPLSALVMYSQLGQRMLSEGQNDPDKLAGVLDKVSTQGQRAGQIIEQLRRLVRKEKSHRIKADINALVREIAELADIEIRHRRASLRLELAENLPPVHVDPGQIQQVLLNLIQNAVAAMQDTPAEQRTLTLRTTQIDEPSFGIEISVADTGPGLSAEAQAKLFKPFFTTKSDGMGLGLSLCRSIVNSHQGRLWASSNPERGATFHFTLPIAGEG